MPLSTDDIALIDEYAAYVLHGSWSDDRTCTEALGTLPEVMVKLAQGDRAAFATMAERLRSYKAEAVRYLPGNDPGAPIEF
jgi:hypothetical protein